MSWRSVIIWAALIVVPLIPVIALYWLFRELNYFELADAARGLVATGPIAAYVAIVAIGTRTYFKLNRLPALDERALKRVLGTWSFEARSSHQTIRHGAAHVTEDRGQIFLNGTLCDEEDSQVGSWESTMAQLQSQRLSFVYNLREARDGKEEASTALCMLSLDPNTPSLMRGRWIVMGRNEALGEITYSRKSVQTREAASADK